MQNIKDFISFALSHAKTGAQPWHYLYGSVRVQTTQDTLNRYYINHYHSQMTRARYDKITANWLPTDFATDCEGLLDAYLTYECGQPTDINADMNYRNWCTDKGRIDEIDRPWIVGEAVFRQNANGRMGHVGWICGFDGDEPLIVEARNIAYGVVVSRLSDRLAIKDFTHRGLMTVIFDYTEDKTMIDFSIISPMPTGEPYLAMQHALNLAGYTDDDGRMLEEDGKWGKRSKQAFDKLIAAHAAEPEPAVEPFASFTSDDGQCRALLFRMANLPEV